jgi:hypothetical protein
VTPFFGSTWGEDGPTHVELLDAQTEAKDLRAQLATLHARYAGLVEAAKRMVANCRSCRIGELCAPIDGCAEDLETELSKLSEVNDGK